VTDSFFYPYVTRQVGGWTQELAWSVATSYAMAVIGVLIGAVTIIRIWKGKHDGLTGQLVLASLILFAIGVTMGNISWDEAQPHQVTEEFSMTKAVSGHYGVEARDAVCPGGTWTRHTDDCVTYTDKDGSGGAQQVTVEKLGGAQPAPTSSTKEETK